MLIDNVSRDDLVSRLLETVHQPRCHSAATASTSAGRPNAAL